MNEPWFSEAYAWIPGTLLGCLGGLWGALVGIFAPQGKARNLVVFLYWVLLIGSAIMLAAGVIALATGQPYGVWYGLGLAGAIGVTILGFNGRMMYAAYQRAEARRVVAHNL